MLAQTARFTSAQTVNINSNNHNLSEVGSISATDPYLQLVHITCLVTVPCKVSSAHFSSIQFISFSKNPLQSLCHMDIEIVNKYNTSRRTAIKEALGTKIVTLFFCGIA